MIVAPRLRSRWLVATLTLAMAGDLAKGAQPAVELAAAGGDELLWATLGEWDSDHNSFIQQLVFRTKSGVAFLSPLNVGPQKGGVDRIAVVQDRLHLFFKDGVHVSYTTEDGSRREIALPDRRAPLAVAAESDGARGSIWAIVKASTADAVETEWRAERDRLLGEQIDAGDEVADSQPASVPSVDLAELELEQVGALPRTRNSFHLVRYDGRAWLPGFELPPGYEPSHANWLCASSGRLHLFWQVDVNDQRVRYAWAKDKKWTEAGPLQVGASIDTATAFVTRGKLVFAALLSTDATPRQLRCAAWTWWPSTTEPHGGKWTQAEEFVDGEEAPLRLSMDATLAGFGDNRIALLERTEEGYRAGYWPMDGGKPDEPMQAMRIHSPQALDGDDQSARNLIALGAMLGVFVLVFWRRQDSISQPAVLPETLTLASPGKRFLAALIDMTPAVAVVMLLWGEEILTMSSDLEQTFSAAVAPESALWISLTGRGVYTVYCLLFELAMHTTPGKRLMKCRVIHEEGMPASVKQIVVRNLSRVVEFDPYLMLWMFTMLIFVTRKRQRLGDLVARTIVVEPCEPITPPTQPSEDDAEAEPEKEDER